jgi:Fic family protein
MKVPPNPPDVDTVLNELVADNRLGTAMQRVRGTAVDGKYLHWDRLRYYQPPQGLTHREWWGALSFNRSVQQKNVPLLDKHGRPFRYLMPDPIPEKLHQMDQGAGGFILMPEQITNPQTRDRYYVSSLIEEAITSSQLEGATTTREIAKEMLQAGREPQDRSERMILNNFLTMRRIGGLKAEPFTKELVFEMHRLVTDQTLDDLTAAGRFRRADENVAVMDAYGTVFHLPPAANELERRMEAMCAFANGNTPDEFLHPVLRAIILHFWLAYDHPFKDGNGRTARALFYWSMLRHRFWLCEFISISRISLKAPVQYGRAYLYTETDGNDLTYFILYHLEVITRAIQELHDYIQRKSSQLQRLEKQVLGIALLNHRQRALIGHALRHPLQRYTIESHRKSHNVVYQTARTDLLDLKARGLLEAMKIGRTWTFSPAGDLEARLATLA